ncbi:hypothetical protein TWF696_004434 [Orbilia brochopaga]|uniref:SAP domain-containing protein n=1 Tax=Orbilia brochopaga TaxID=3140254 RepID=A0AAV9V7B5_9PEZI
MTDYNKLKVADLKELLGKRGLSQSGKKEELISRLTADDADKASPANDKTAESSSVPSAPPTAPATTGPPVEKKEIQKDAGSAVPPATSAASTGTAAPVEGEKKKFTFKRLADEFETPATEAPADKPTTKTDEAKPAEPAEPAESFSAGLASTNADSELEKRKKRAARFGVPVSESIKLMERAKRFGADGDDANGDGVKGLDQALGENRGKKRAPETRIQNEPPKKSKDNPRSAPTAKGVLSDPTEKAKAEARAKRFGG